MLPHVFSVWDMHLILSLELDLDLDMDLDLNLNLNVNVDQKLELELICIALYYVLIDSHVHSSISMDVHFVCRF